MKIKELIDIEYKGWYVESTYDNKIILKSDYTKDILAEIYITLEKENYVIVSYSSSNGEGVFFYGSNITSEEVSERTVIAAEEYFDYE